ncbi:protein of unassigned function [Methylobacterium oryzae CBMB20]|uniref:Protein of unassigned function n=1 Tax=Methylobacterium oryzae CBMB20 TaxID=693986 RepID=A0A089NNC8_9HYPH|nr:protein of unassigned function [Methylobacterium oryzae CBMB20]
MMLLALGCNVCVRILTLASRFRQIRGMGPIRILHGARRLRRLHQVRRRRDQTAWPKSTRGCPRLRSAMPTVLTGSGRALIGDPALGRYGHDRRPESHAPRAA